MSVRVNDCGEREVCCVRAPHLPARSAGGRGSPPAPSVHITCLPTIAGRSPVSGWRWAAHPDPEHRTRSELIEVAAVRRDPLRTDTHCGLCAGHCLWC